MRERYFHATDMRQLINDGIKYRRPRRIEKFDEARAMLRKYVELRDDELLEKEFGMNRYRKKLRELRAENEQLKAVVERLTGELNDFAERYDQEYECDISELNIKKSDNQ